ncbi:hypothetical protein NBRC116493_12790 [Aurantivibrio infirmus]
MKIAKSKAQERNEIESQINRFLKNGGNVKSIESGVSGREIGSYKLAPVAFSEPKESRTPLTDEVKAIEARKSQKRIPASAQKPKRPRKVLITDDFGEPLRWSWTDS